jgi:class 3 adenylate cyclase
MGRDRQREDPHRSAARIVDLAGPGEVLCSEATADAIGDRADGRVTGTSSR